MLYVANVLYVANMTSVEKQDIIALNVMLLYVRHHVSEITTPQKKFETDFLYFLKIFGFILYI